MTQFIDTWSENDKLLLEDHLKDLINKGYIIQQIIQDKIKGNELFYQTARAIIVISK